MSNVSNVKKKAQMSNIIHIILKNGYDFASLLWSQPME